MDPYTDHERPYGHTGTKCPSVAELGVLHAKLGKKTYTSHVRVLGNVHGPRTAGTVTREKLRKTAGTRAMENWAKRRTRHVRVHGPVHGPKTAGTVKELHVRHGKLGKTTYYARTRTWTRARTKNGRYRDTGIFLPDARL